MTNIWDLSKKADRNSWNTWKTPTNCTASFKKKTKRFWCSPFRVLRSSLIHPFPFFVHQAVCQNNVKTVKFLLECGVDPNVRDLYGYTPLKNAEVLENEVMIAILQSAMDARTSAVAN